MITLFQANLSLIKQSGEGGVQGMKLEYFRENLQVVKDSLEIVRAEVRKAGALKFEFTESLLRINQNEEIRKANRKLGDIYQCSLYFNFR